MLRALPVAAVLAGVALSAQAADPMTLRVMTFNIWYGGEQVSLATVADAIRRSGADIVGLQETDGKLERLAEMTRLPYSDVRRNIISRFPIFDPALGERQAPGSGPYTMPSLDEDAVAAYVLVAPGRMVAVANTHLTSDPYGPYVARDGGTPDDVLQTEAETRVEEAQLLADGLAPLAAAGIPVFLTGDFNSPSHLDWTAEAVGAIPSVSFELAWPVSVLLEAAGFADSYREAHPDPVASPGLTWTPGSPLPFLRDGEVHDRIDRVLHANARAVASDVVGETGGPDVAIGVDPWPSDHRAVVSTFEVVPVEAPALIAVEPVRVTTDGEFNIRVNVPGRGDWSGLVVPRGGDPEDAVTGIAGVPLLDRPSIRLGARHIAPGAYDAVLLDGDGAEQARTQFYVVAADAAPALVLDKSVYAVGEPIGVSWEASMGERFEWLGTYEAGASDVYGYLSFTYTGGHVNGSRTITTDDYGDPLPPGDYELRLLRDDSYALEASAAFSVR